MKMNSSTFHNQIFLYSSLKHFHFVHLQGLKMCSFNDSDEKKKKLEYLSHMLDSFTQILPKNKQFFFWGKQCRHFSTNQIFCC